MSNQTAIKQISNALKTLGVHGHIKVIHKDFSHYQVFVSNSYFGIFDLERDTFVD